VAFYLDTSAAAKLVLAESGSRAMSAWARSHAGAVVSSDLLRTELLQAVRRGAIGRMQRARAVLESIGLIGLRAETFERAAELEPLSLRTLDALHLAAALELGDDLDGIVTYDQRLAEAASTYGIAVVAPTRTT